MKHNLQVRLLTVALCVCGIGCQAPLERTDSVDPFIGSAATGHTYPAATTPFGMVQAGPDTGIEGWQHSSGYHADDTSILGFSHTHLSGTGASDMGDILLMPQTGTPQFEPGPADDPESGYRSRFDRTTEKASPGYYSVVLSDYDIRVEITATPRGAMHRYVYPKEKPAGVLLDLVHGIGDRTTESDIQVVNDRSLCGFRRSKGFIADHRYYFHITFSEPFETVQTIRNPQTGAPEKLYVSFAEEATLLAKVALSTVSEEGARRNLEAELPDWDFDRTRRQARQLWETALSTIDATFSTAAQRTVFYTALYHSLLTPNLITDVDGAYRGWDRELHPGDGTPLYTNYSLWDTYRAVHPFYALLYPDANLAFIRSMLERYRQIGMLPMNEYGTNETYCMIGYHAIPVIAQAILEGREGFDPAEAYQAMKASAMDDARGVGLMKRYGYIPSELENNSVSKTLEYAYDDWCIARVAAKLGERADSAYFMGRALNYRNHLDPQTRFMRGRHADGRWVEPFDPKAVSVLGQGDFTEGNSWQYSFYAPQDLENLIDRMGGDTCFAAKLDTLFSIDSHVDNAHAVDVTGLIGQYAHGNEPSHHIAYLYNYAGMPWKTQEIVSRIKRELYSERRDGLCGNDDCGQMSCWYLYSALGFYPVTPGLDYYTIGTPSVEQAVLRLPNGRTFTVRTENAAPEHIYIQSVRLNGQPYSKSYLPIDLLEAGGTLEFTMGPRPNRNWATANADRPQSRIDSSRK